MERVRLTVFFEVSPLSKTAEKHWDSNAFSTNRTSLAEHNYPIAEFQRTYCHPRDLLLLPVEHVQPLILIGSDMPLRGRIAVCTWLDWSKAQ